MSSYGEKRDKRDEIMSGDFKAMQDGIQKSRSGRSGTANKKKNRMLCIGFLVILIIAVITVVAISL